MKFIWNLEAKEQTVPAQLLMCSSGNDIERLMKLCHSETEMKTNLFLFIFGINPFRSISRFTNTLETLFISVNNKLFVNCNDYYVSQQ